ncbi:MAG: FKBP-type peptidyl-prolyl cis-trans isomerase [Ignavibacteriae bacterium]|nr:FKBP-type peptidyl-prolyl cis-trans isomerase [Ignavibacteriota bacterium]MCB9215952.1 FKBP-type peptidyl-prolyl cis-trans isomerase [Ignavibacteria bacterium]
MIRRNSILQFVLVFPLLFSGLATVAQSQNSLKDLTDSVSYAIGMNFTVTELIPSFEAFGEQGVAVNPEFVGRTIGNQLLAKTTEYTAADSVSYSHGLNMVNKTLMPALLNLQALGIAVNREVMAQAINDILAGRKTVISDSVAQRALVVLQQVIVERTGDFVAQFAEESKKEEVKFLADNGTKPGVKTTPSGLQYQVLAEGSGASPTIKDSVSVRCLGKLINGTIFDQTEEGKSVKCAVAGVVPGWSEALMMMKPGSKWLLYIPSNLGYGSRGGLGGKIGPNQLMIYEIELIRVN